MPDRNRKPSGGRPEFELAGSTKEPGRRLQRQMLQQLSQLGEGNRRSHGEDLAPDAADPPPSQDRAG